MIHEVQCLFMEMQNQGTLADFFPKLYMKWYRFSHETSFDLICFIVLFLLNFPCVKLPHIIAIIKDEFKFNHE